MAVEAEASHPVPQDPAPEQPPRRAGPGLGQDPPGARAGEVVAGRPPVPRDSGQPEGGSGRQEAASGPSSPEAPVEKAAGAQAAARSHGEGASDPDDRIPSGEQHRPRAEGAWGPALPAAPGDVPSSTSALGAPSPRGDALTGAEAAPEPCLAGERRGGAAGISETQKPAAAGDTPPGPGLAAEGAVALSTAETGARAPGDFPGAGARRMPSGVAPELPTPPGARKAGVASPPEPEEAGDPHLAPEAAREER